MHRGIALFGHNISYSISPLIHNIAFSITRLPFTYLPVDIGPEKLEEALNAVRTLGFAGANVTIPYKERMLDFTDVLSETARAIGAVNTLRFEENRIYGENTDAEGFFNAYREDLQSLSGKTVLLLGAGGAARAVLNALIVKGQPSKIYIAARSPERAERIRSDAVQWNGGARIEILPWEPDAINTGGAEAEGIIQTTPIGSGDTAGKSPVPETFPFTTKHTVIELIYKPIETAFLKHAARQGARTRNGMSMLLHQAALAFTVWTGSVFPMEQIYETVMRPINNSS